MQEGPCHPQRGHLSQSMYEQLEKVLLKPSVINTEQWKWERNSTL